MSNGCCVNPWGAPGIRLPPEVYRIKDFRAVANNHGATISNSISFTVLFLLCIVILIEDLSIVHATPEAAEGLFSFLPENTPWFAWAGAAMVAIPLGIQRLISLTNQVEAVAETVECIADRVGHVAADIDKAADEMLEKLPEGKLKDFVGRVEDLAEATAKEAQRVEDLMDKVEEMSNNMEDFLVETTKKAKADAKSEYEKK